MWFPPSIFELCNELKTWGVLPRFEPGHVVARGFADLGYEEFQVLPGPKILSLTAGTIKPLPEEHIHHFFWLPSVDESIQLLEQSGAEPLSCQRVDRRRWVATTTHRGTSILFEARSLYEALLQLLLQVKQAEHRGLSSGDRS